MPKIVATIRPLNLPLGLCGVITGGIPSPCISPTGPAPPAGWGGGGGTSESKDGGGVCSGVTVGLCGFVSPAGVVTGVGFIAVGSELSGIFKDKET